MTCGCEGGARVVAGVTVLIPDGKADAATAITLKSAGRVVGVEAFGPDPGAAVTVSANDGQTLVAGALVTGDIGGAPTRWRVRSGRMGAAETVQVSAVRPANKPTGAVYVFVNVEVDCGG